VDSIPLSKSAELKAILEEDARQGLANLTDTKLWAKDGQAERQRN
jgi:hypothetical protein